MRVRQFARSLVINSFPESDVQRPHNNQRTRSSGSQTRRSVRWRSASAIVISATVVAVAAVAVGSHPNVAPTRTGVHITAAGPRLSRAEVQYLEHMTPAQAATLTRVINTAYARLGVHVGISRPGSDSLPANTIHGQARVTTGDTATLTSVQWAAGVQWNHIWVTASYANLEPFANNFWTVVQVATSACGRLSGWWGVACSAIGSLIAIILSDVHVSNWSPYHGIWAAYYWFPWTYRTGGTW